MSKMCTFKNFNYSASQRAPLNFNVNYVTVVKYTCTYQISTKLKLKYLRAFTACTSTWNFCLSKSLLHRIYDIFLLRSMVKAYLLCNDSGIKLLFCKYKDCFNCIINFEELTRKKNYWF